MRRKKVVLVGDKLLLRWLFTPLAVAISPREVEKAENLAWWRMDTFFKIFYVLFPLLQKNQSRGVGTTAHLLTDPSRLEVGRKEC